MQDQYAKTLHLYPLEELYEKLKSFFNIIKQRKTSSNKFNKRSKKKCSLKAVRFYRTALNKRINENRSRSVQ